MRTDFPCPLCDSDCWIAVAEHRYSREAVTQRQPPAPASRSPGKLRCHVLFEIWFDGGQEVQLTSLYCHTCGFLTYSPRPAASDLAAKYEYLRQHEATGAADDGCKRTRRLSHRRATAMLRRLAPHHPVRNQRVLDVGGGDGHLLIPFASHDCELCLVDFNEHPRAGVQRLGSTIEDVPIGRTFDIIICSHVLEHVSDPRQLLLQIRSILATSGAAYVEVPLEVWRGIPISRDPVTHVNFFTPASLRALLTSCGLHVCTLRSTLSTYGEMYKRVVWAVVTPGPAIAARPQLSCHATEVLLRPHLAARAGRLIESCWLHGVLNLEPRLRPLAGRARKWLGRHLSTSIL